MKLAAGYGRDYAHEGGCTGSGTRERVAVSEVVLTRGTEGSTESGIHKRVDVPEVVLARWRLYTM